MSESIVPLSINTAYFFSPTSQLFHITACIMQGFKKLGIRNLTNISADQIGSRGISTPFSRTDFTAAAETVPDLVVDTDLIVIDTSGGLDPHEDAINHLIKQKNTMLICGNDGSNYVRGTPDTPLFCAHLNRYAKHAGILAPIAFGLSDDLIAMSEQHDLTQKKLAFIDNFNPTRNQDVRLSLELSFVEPLSRHFEIDRRKTTPETYAEQLAETVAVLAYGGSYYADWRRHAGNKAWIEKNYPMYDFARFDCNTAIFRWDSWRFWEAAAFACTPIHLDFHKYGFELPVPPEPWVHYIPIDLAEVSSLPAKIATRLKEEPRLLEIIGQNARKWAIENYSPEAAARYILGTLLDVKQRLSQKSSRPSPSA